MKPLGIPWEASKDIPFSPVVPFIGFEWNLTKKVVSLPSAKKYKYLRAISEWKTSHTHEVHKLYGKLLYTCHIAPRGCTYLTNFKKMMAIFGNHLFVPRYPPKSLLEDLSWWESTLRQPSLTREIPGICPITNVKGSSDASFPWALKSCLT
jgi:hypothetical protein